MEIDKQSKIEFWRSHVRGAEKHPVSVANYCSENDLRIATYYSWRNIIKQEEGIVDEKIHLPKKSRIKKPKKNISPFLPVKVSPALTNFQNPVGRVGLPDARWVAEVMLCLVRGLS
ncbi:MAG: hypothetical protein H0X02_12370 [Nitrosomonas sp.]|nr:hypothetical protein [Nitrosomonas sp.]